MPRVQIRVTQDPATHEQLKAVAARLSKQPATLAAELIADGLARLERSEVRSSPSLELRKWLEPYLEDLRHSGDWPPDITFLVFDKIRDEARELYEAAAKEVGQTTLNREIGRLVKDRLGASVMEQNGHPKLVKAARGRNSLIQAATLLKSARRSPGQP